MVFLKAFKYNDFNSVCYLHKHTLCIHCSDIKNFRDHQREIWYLFYTKVFAYLGRSVLVSRTRSDKVTDSISERHVQSVRNTPYTLFGIQEFCANTFCQK